MKPAIFDTEARAELADAMEYYELQRPGLGGEFREEVEKALHRIQMNPEFGAPYKHTEQRRQAVRRFPFEIFYSVLADRIWVAAIAHSKRRPDYWKGRHPE